MQPPRRMLAGPVSGDPDTTESLDGNCLANAVFLNVYDLGDGQLIKQLNQLFQVGGAFHAGVEVYNEEWHYGYVENDGAEVKSVSGLGCCAPRSHSDHSYNGSVLMGYTPYTKEQVTSFLTRMSKEWQSNDYDILHNNCLHYCDSLCHELHVHRLPAWVDRGARVAAGIDSTLRSAAHILVGNSQAGKLTSGIGAKGYAVVVDRPDDENCALPDDVGVSSAPAQPRKMREETLPAGYRNGDAAFYCGEPHTTASGEQVTFGLQGIVCGKGPDARRLRIRFIGFKQETVVMHRLLSRDDPLQSVGKRDWHVGDRIYWIGSKTRFENGDMLAFGLQGCITGRAASESSVMVQFDGNAVSCNVDLKRTSSRPPLITVGYDDTEEVGVSEWNDGCDDDTIQTVNQPSGLMLFQMCKGGSCLRR